MTATIIFRDGSQISVYKNADCYISASKPEFPNPIGAVSIEAEDGNKEYNDAQLVECASIDGRYWFAFMEMPEDEKLKKRISDLESVNEMLEECILEMSEIIYA